jgi:protein TonB
VTEPKGYAGYLNNPAPTYPPAAQLRRLQGRVLLKVHVLASGQPDSVDVAQSSGFDILDAAAVKAVAAWSFDPAKRGSKPIDGWVNVPINFKLS